jgi:hypothetical protein
LGLALEVGLRDVRGLQDALDEEWLALHIVITLIRSCHARNRKQLSVLNSLPQIVLQPDGFQRPEQKNQRREFKLLHLLLNAHLLAGLL